MATPAAVLSILVTASTGQAVTKLSGVQKQLGAAGATASTTESKFSKTQKAAGALGLVMGGALALGAKAGWNELKESARVGAQTNAVLKSTHGAANVTAAGIDKLAGSLLKKTGIDDEVIKSGANMLLTFTNVRNEAGKGNDIFDRSTKTLLDMSTALGTDASKTAIQLGKALNDPIKGVTALRRVGVQFTDAQTAQIKKMVESGNVMGAQKLILKELNKEFGGSAEAAGKTLPGQLNRLKETFNNLAGSVVQAVMPAFQSLLGPMQDVADFLTEHKTLTQVLVGVFTGLAAAVIAVAVGTKLYATAVTMATAAQWLFNVAVSANPIMLVVIALAALAAGLYLAYKHVGPFRDAVDTLWGTLKDVFGWVKDHWPLLLAIITGPIGLAVLAISKYGGDIVDIFKELPGKIVGAIKAGATAIVEAGRWIVNRIVDGVKAVAGAIGSAAGWVKDRFLEGVRAYADAFSTVGSWVLNRIVDGIKTITEGLANVGVWLKNRVVETVHGAIEGFTGLGGWVVDRIAGGIKGSLDAIKDAAKWLKDKVVGAVKDFFGINSPSKVMMELGGHIASGLIKGVVGADVGGFIKSHLGGIANMAQSVLGSIGSLPGKGVKAIKGLFGGDANTGTDGHPGNISGALLPFIGLAHRMGLVVTSTTDGRHAQGSNHYTGHAVDIGGSGGEMMEFARQALGFATSLRELFYDPLGVYVKNGAIIQGAIGGHMDHVHVALAKGGLMPTTGWALVGERGPELAKLPGGTRVYSNQQSAQMGVAPAVIQVVIQDGAVDPNKIRVIASNEAEVVVRRETRQGVRSLPGRGGGLR